MSPRSSAGRWRHARVRCARTCIAGERCRVKARRRAACSRDHRRPVGSSAPTPPDRGGQSDPTQTYRASGREQPTRRRPVSERVCRDRLPAVHTRHRSDISLRSGGAGRLGKQFSHLVAAFRRQCTSGEGREVRTDPGTRSPFSVARNDTEGWRRTATRSRMQAAVTPTGGCRGCVAARARLAGSVAGTVHERADPWCTPPMRRAGRAAR